MSIDLKNFPFDGDLLFTEKDDQMHSIEHPNVDWTETTWWTFNIPERGLFGWLYAQIRPNLGSVAGGAFVYGPNGWLSWEIPYFGWFNHQPLPQEFDLRDVSFRNGIWLKTLKPGMSYDYGFKFRDHDEFIADLRFEGLTPPVPHVHGAPPFVGSHHYDQHGHITGSIQLHGETIPVDCYSIRDRSWGRRPELLGMGVPRCSYVYGTVSAQEFFLVFSAPENNEPDCEVEHNTSGYLVRDGVLRRLQTSTRTNERDPATGAISKVAITGSDTDGREFNIIGEPVSRMALNHGGICINSFLKFDVDGREGWGEDQDVWSVAMLRKARELRLKS